MAAACSSVGQSAAEDTQMPAGAAGGTAATPAAVQHPARGSVQADSESAAGPRKSTGPQVYRGSGIFVDAGVSGAAEAGTEQEGEITLNFEDTDIQEVIKTILGDTLKQNYIIDPSITGSVNLQTTQPLLRNDLMPILETLLRMNGAALVEGEGAYKILPLAAAARSSLSPRLGPVPSGGYRVQVIPLRYIAATEMEKILVPLIPKESILRVDQARNLLMVAASGPELAGVLETVKIFDVDWLKGMSIGLFPIHNSDARQLAEDLTRLFGEEAPAAVADMVRFVPIERLNSIMVITPQARYLDQVGTWIDRLDIIGDQPGQRLFVYDVKNRNAKELADLLNGVFGGRAVEETRPVRLAPGLEPVELRTVDSEYAVAETQGEQVPVRGGPPEPEEPPSVAATEGLAFTGVGRVSVHADEANNSILILASAQDYKLVEASLSRLDIVPLQVLVEASIMEVGLTDELRYGIQWTFDTGLGGGKTGTGTLSFGNSPQLANGPFPGFTYSIVNSVGNIKAILSALANQTSVNVLSNPALMVLDNQAATIRVGDQVPVRTSEVTSLDSSAVSPLVYGNIEYRDTGVLLTVKPQVNPGGLVTLEITQEVNDVASTTTSGIDSPTINQRRITTIAAVQSGETVVLGGLIRDRTDNSESGVPFLYKLPVIGKLFGETSEVSRRTELVVVITPRVLRSPEDARQISDEFRNKMKGLQKQTRPSEPMGHVSEQRVTGSGGSAVSAPP
jgi:general secretion pathway protein D